MKILITYISYFHSDDNCLFMKASILFINSPLFEIHFFSFISSEVNLRRHIACEPCIGYVNGGFDPNLNQVKLTQSVFVH